ncbi:MAG: ferrous iron transport protein B [Proteobacteria bacterium]|nr:ferrous iron transport protein B [Pseudomonadota bacterium]
MSKEDKKGLTIALAGNPNCGKTTVFNGLTGANQHVGNYSGVTVEKRDGSFKLDDTEVKVIDLPGTYSLNSHSPEERVAQDELLSGEIDLLVAIIDTGSISRSMLFVAQLMQLDIPMILVLNMWDEVEKSGMKIDIDQMKALLGMPVIPMVASKKVGLDELKAAIAAPETRAEKPSRLRLGDVLTNAVQKIKAELPDEAKAFGNWTATRLLLNDQKYVDFVSPLSGGVKALAVAKEQREHIQADTKMDIDLYVTEQYAGFADGMLREVVKSKPRADARETSDKIDKILAHPLLGIPIFLLIIFVLFWATFTLGAYPMDWISAGFDALKGLIMDGMGKSHPILASLLGDGIIGGVGGVLVFLPNILILFIGLSFLEDTGYMARAAFLIDKVMHKFGLHGRSFIPLITGMGCSVPGIMATRTIAGEKERLTTMLIVPFISCGARVPIWALLVPVFFLTPTSQALALFCIYIGGALVGLCVALALRKTVFKGKEEPFVMELPPYRLPTLRAVFMHMWERGWLYLKKAGTIILALAILLWWASAFPTLSEEQEEAVTAQVQQANPEIYADASQYLKNHPELAEDDDKKDEAKDEKKDEAEEEDPAAPACDFDKQIYAQMKKYKEDKKLGDDLDDDQKKAVKAQEEKYIEELKAKDPALFADNELCNQNEAFNKLVENAKAEKQLEDSYMATVGKAIQPIFAPLGFDWKVSTAVLGSLAAKEVFVSQMGIVYSLGSEINVDDKDDEAAGSLRSTLQHQYNLLQGICLIIFMLLTSPCIASLAVIKRESNSWKIAVAQFFGMFALAWLLAAIVYFIGHFFI